MPRNNHKQIAIWLFACCFMVALMVVVGGLTRLTESGLSITEWKPITGIIPPHDEETWQQEFTSYQQSPEYIKKNQGISLEEFKSIFWLEFIHRFIGRITGFIFALPLLYFAVTRKITFPFAVKISGIFLLGGLQGLMGWYMVKSGLVDDPRVSPYRLAAHLLLAFLIFGLLFWNALEQWFAKEKIKKQQKLHSLRKISFMVTALILLQVTAGAFVAGLDAGLTYNTFPLMDGKLVPDGLLVMEPPLINFFENITTVQFNHRVLAFIVLFFIIYFWFRCQGEGINKRTEIAVNTLITVALVQVSLGIATLLLAVPILLASLHQFMALIIFAVSLFINWELCARVRVNKGI